MNSLRNTLLLAGSVLALFLIYLYTNRHYPWYFLWDMDFVTALDVLLMRDGALPTHIHHTEFGLFLFYKHLSTLLSALGWTSAASIQALHTALNPFPAVAEFLDYLRLTLPCFCLLLVLALWACLFLAEPLKKNALLLPLIFLFILGLQDALIINSAAIRSELASVLFWSLALLALTLRFTARAQKRGNGLLLLAGLLLGLAFLTKLQSAVYIVLALLYAVFLALDKANAKDVPLPTWRLRHLLIAALSLLFFCWLAYAAWRFYVPCDDSVTELEYHFGGYGEPTYRFFNGIAFPALLALLAVLALNLLPCFFPRTPPWLANASAFLSLITGGFMAAFLLHFLCYAKPATGYAYLLTDFKMLFFRSRDQFLPASLSPTILHNREHLVALLRHEAPLFITHALLMALLALGMFRRKLPLPLTAFGVLVLLSALATFNTLFMLRFDDKDLIWIEIIFTFLSLLAALLLLNRGEAGVRWACLFLLLFLLAGTGNHLQTRHRRIDANWNIFGWKDSWMAKGIFGGHAGYDALLTDRYPGETEKRLALRAARRHAFDRRALNFVFQNQDLTLLDTGLVATGFPLWRDDLRYRIRSYSPALEEALLIDNSAQPPQDFALYKKALVRRVASFPNKFRSATPPYPLAVLVRADLESIFFVETTEVDALLTLLNDAARPVAQTTPYQIAVEKNGVAIEFSGIHVYNYAEIPLHQLKGRYFTVLKRYIDG